MKKLINRLDELTNNATPIVCEFVKDYQYNDFNDTIQIEKTFIEFVSIKVNTLTNSTLIEWYINNINSMNEFIKNSDVSLNNFKDLYDFIKSAISYTLEKRLYIYKEEIIEMLNILKELNEGIDNVRISIY